MINVFVICLLLNHFVQTSVSWILAGMAALPFLFFTDIYHADLSGQAWTINSTCPKLIESSQCSLINTTVNTYLQ